MCAHCHFDHLPAPISLTQIEIEGYFVLCIQSFGLREQDSSELSFSSYGFAKAERRGDFPAASPAIFRGWRWLFWNHSQWTPLAILLRDARILQGRWKLLLAGGFRRRIRWHRGRRVDGRAVS